MSDLSPEDRTLVEIGARDDVPDPGARDRVRQRLALRLGAGAGLGAATVATKSAVAMTLTTKILLTVAIVGLAGGGGAVLMKRGAPAVAPSSRSASLVSATSPLAPTVIAAASTNPPPLATLEPPPIVLSATPATTASVAAAPPPPDAPRLPTRPSTVPPRSPEPSGQNDTATPPSGGRPGGGSTSPSSPVDALAEETRLLRAANTATRAGQPAQALALLDEHQRRFPQGVLAEEREAERVLALCASGRTDEARAAASRFLAAHPRSALAGRVRAACAAP